MRKFRAEMAGALFLLLAAGCSKGGSENYPLFTPPVKAAAPSGFVNGSSFVGAAKSTRMLNLDPKDFKDRFFNEGPTDLFGILTGIDNRIIDINSRATNQACLNTTPVAYTI